VAAGISKNSGGKIKTGIYHADVGDKNKESLHKRWRQGQIQVVCATIGETQVNLSPVQDLMALCLNF
jgi:superfamily II DNA helicase RecQ